ncbi:MAG: glycosyltransferase [Oscillospiraceae bacterium]|jgi:glycosyltransferase involved in cell wall biosynthesis|nr:glycosyltransferase [Oscillospiraceae bacterium]
MDNTLPLICIIVPIYNAERFLEDALKSLQVQDYENIRVIMVNDGSVDCSEDIALQFAGDDARFVYIDHTVNRGSGAAYNTGLAAAYDTGCEYICFLDNDDIAEPFMVETLYDTIRVTDAPVALCDFTMFTETEIFVRHIFADIADGVYNTADYPSVFHSDPCPWNKIYRTEFMRENRNAINFIERAGLQFADTSFYIKLMITARKFAYRPKSIVNYRIYDGQSVNSKKDPTDTLIEEFNESVRFLNALEIDNRLDKKLSATYFNIRFAQVYFQFLERLSPEYKERYKRLMQEYFSEQAQRGNFDGDWRNTVYYDNHKNFCETERVFD